MNKNLTASEEATLSAYNHNATAWSTKHSTTDFWKDELANFQKSIPNGKILDVGAGGGRDTRQLKKMGYECKGFDMSKELLKIARKKNPGVVFDESSIYDIDYDREFDGFWCSAMLLHIPRAKISEALVAIKKSVKQHGVGFISIKEGQGEITEADGRQFIYWQDDQFSEVLKNHGFKILSRSYRPMSERTKWLSYIVELLD